MRTPKIDCNKCKFAIGCFDGCVGFVDADMVIKIEQLEAEVKWLKLHEEAFKLHLEKTEYIQKDARGLFKNMLGMHRDDCARIVIDRLEAEVAAEKAMAKHHYDSWLHMCTKWGKKDVEVRGLEAEVEHYKQIIQTDCEYEKEIRILALKVLTDKQINGDSYGVPTLPDIMELVVAEVERLNKLVALYQCDNDDEVDWIAF